MTQTTDNTPLDGQQGGDAEGGDGVNWNAAQKFFSQNADTPAPAEGQDDGQETEYDYTDEEGNPLTAEEVAALQAEGAEIEDAPEEDGLVEVRVRGQILQLPPEQAAAIEETRREQRERDGRLGGENAQLRDRLARLEGAVEERGRGDSPATELQPPDPNIARTDFPKYMQLRDEYELKRLELVTQGIRTEYETEKANERYARDVEARNKAWADAFYSENPHFNKPAIKPLVGQVYDEHKEELNNYGTDYVSAMDRLAELTDARLAEIRGSNKPGRTVPRVQGAGAGAAPAAASTKPAPFSTSNWVAAERAKMKGDQE